MVIDKLAVRDVLDAAYKQAVELDVSQDLAALEATVGAELLQVAQSIAETRHAGRGVMLTLMAVKASHPSVDTRYNKTEHGAVGWSARAIDTEVTIPFLNANELHASAESHWLTQAFSLGTEPWLSGAKLNVNPKSLGPQMIQLVNDLEDRYSHDASGSDSSGLAFAVVVVLLLGLVEQRNRSRVHLQRPKNRTVDQVVQLLVEHTRRTYRYNAPRLPQLIVYALYRCMLDSMLRYTGCELDNLQKMKAADRKAGTVGDVVVSRNGSPFEAVETKLERPIDVSTVVTAIEKVKTAAVERYLILSTGGLAEYEEDEVWSRCAAFRSSNGCEVIAANLFDVVQRYLELIPSANEFIHEYCSLVETDKDLDYEHRAAWNEICTAAS